MPKQASTTEQTLALPETSLLGTLAGTWGVIGVLVLLSRALWKLTPLAVEPFEKGGLSAIHWGLYAVFIVFMAYSEGYKGFQKAFAPRVVARAFHLARHPKPLHVLLAPFFCMGLFHATRKRLIISWVLTIFVVALVLSVPLLPYPWRNIVDAGVVVGLTWGALSVLVLALMAVSRGDTDVPPEVPEGK